MGSKRESFLLKRGGGNLALLHPQIPFDAWDVPPHQIAERLQSQMIASLP